MPDGFPHGLVQMVSDRFEMRRQPCGGRRGAELLREVMLPRLLFGPVTSCRSRRVRFPSLDGARQGLDLLRESIPFGAQRIHALLVSANSRDSHSKRLEEWRHAFSALERDRLEFGSRIIPSHCGTSVRVPTLEKPADPLIQSASCAIRAERPHVRHAQPTTRPMAITLAADCNQIHSGFW